jgi:transcriptional regulator with XRE-family HTH domain
MRIRIKEAREHFKEVQGYRLSMERLAELAFPADRNSSLKTKVDTLYRMQRGESTHPSLDVLDRIATVCGVDLNFLIDRDSVMNL